MHPAEYPDTDSSNYDNNNDDSSKAAAATAAAARQETSRLRLAATDELAYRLKKQSIRETIFPRSFLKFDLEAGSCACESDSGESLRQIVYLARQHLLQFTLVDSYHHCPHRSGPTGRR
jgi:hypothetical protein